MPTQAHRPKDTRLQPHERAKGRLAPAGLLRLLEQQLARAGGARVALLVIALSPSDRQLAIGRGVAVRTVLGEVARRVESLLRSDDRYAFASREELWVLLVGLPSEPLAELAARTLLDRLRRPIAVPSTSGSAGAIHLQPSIGVAWTSGPAGLDASSMLAAVTGAAASGQGIRLRRLRGARDHAPNQAQLEQELLEALDGNELEVHFQPQLDLRNGRCSSAEALIRWRRRDGSAANPEAIVAICERRELIVPLTRFTLNTSLRRMSEWSELGLDMSVAVNLSAATLSDPTLPLMVSQALETWGVPANRLTLELTENALIRNLRVAAEAMKQIHDLGCRLSIDDFGTGYSPYTYLRQFSFQELKIDRSFVRHIHCDDGDRRIVQSLVELAHAFGMHAVAEGVEDQESLLALRALGCDLAQGWHVSAALAADDFAKWCLARRDAAMKRQAAAAQP